jgi:hypothetical protein
LPLLDCGEHPETIAEHRRHIRQLGDVRRDPSRLIFGEQLGGRAPMVAVQKIDLPVLLS